jgi:DNA-binding transcriptional regulator LsrR (DeoR family)
MKPADLPDEIVFDVCQMFLDGLGATRIADWLKARGYDLTREQIYPVLNEARKRGHLVLSSPREQVIARRLADRYDKPLPSIRVIDIRGPQALEHVAIGAADLALSIIKELGHTRERVHVGLGAGWTTWRVARRLASRARIEEGVPPLALHALSSGFSVSQPQMAPVSFFSFFDDSRLDVECYGLFAGAMVPSGDYEKVKRFPGVRESFELASEIDVVITSLAQAQHEHGDLYQFLQLGAPKALKALQKAGWVGDVQYRPYSATGPVTMDAEVRAVVLFELADLVRLAATMHKHVVLVAGPCGGCGVTRADALRPLVEQPSLAVWNHLVVDTVTATKLLPP